MANTFVLTESQVIEGLELCRKKVIKYLNDAEVLIANNDKESAHALGLYIFAIEEHGKGLLLKDCHAKIQGNGNVEVPMWIFSQGDLRKINPKPHIRKIQRALADFPIAGSCEIGVFIDMPKLTKKYRRITTPHGTMAIMGSLTGLFSYTGPIDFNVRLQSLYVDWDKEKNEWKSEMTSPNSSLKKAIEAFRKHL